MRATDRPETRFSSSAMQAPAIRGQEVGHEPLLAAGVLGRATTTAWRTARCSRKVASISLEFDPVPRDLDLIVEPAQKFDVSVRTLTAQDHLFDTVVPRLAAERMRNELLACQLGLIQISHGQSVAADE